MNLRRGGGTPPYIFCLLGKVGWYALMPPQLVPVTADFPRKNNLFFLPICSNLA